MIVELLFDVIFGLFNSLISLLPSIDGTIPSTFVNTLSNVIQSTSYFLPVGALLPIVVISGGLEMFNIVWKIILRVKSFIPTMGD